jgi:hypothetical protein
MLGWRRLDVKGPGGPGTRTEAAEPASPRPDIKARRRGRHGGRAGSGQGDVGRWRKKGPPETRSAFWARVRTRAGERYPPARISVSPGDPRGLGRGREGDGRCDVLRPADAPQRRLCLDLHAQVALHEPGGVEALSLYHTRIDRVHADAARPQLLGRPDAGDGGADALGRPGDDGDLAYELTHGLSRSCGCDRRTARRHRRSWVSAGWDTVAPMIRALDRVVIAVSDLAVAIGEAARSPAVLADGGARRRRDRTRGAPGACTSSSQSQPGRSRRPDGLVACRRLAGDAAFVQRAFEP